MDEQLLEKSGLKTRLCHRLVTKLNKKIKVPCKQPQIILCLIWQNIFVNKYFCNILLQTWRFN